MKPDAVTLPPLAGASSFVTLQKRRAQAALQLQSHWRAHMARKELEVRKRRRREEARRAAFEARHGKDKAKAFREQIAANRLLVRRIERHKRLVLHPMKHKYLSWWDLITTTALLYTATLTPYEVSFVPPTLGVSAWAESWFQVNRVLDVIFFVDMVIQFFLAYEARGPRGGTVWVDDHSLIIRNYVTSWFPLDVSTLMVPLGFDLYIASDAGASDLANLSVLRTLRVLRLIKVVRLIRATRVYKRWRSALALNYSAETLLQCVIGIFITAHWYACTIALEASLHTAAEHTWLGPDFYGICSGSWELELSNSTGERQVLPGCEGVGSGRLYLAAFSWSIMVITGTGGTDYYPSSQVTPSPLGRAHLHAMIPSQPSPTMLRSQPRPSTVPLLVHPPAQSEAETLLVTALVINAAFLWTIILAKFCDVATNADPALTSFHQKLDDMNRFILVNNVPKEMARRLREYLLQQKDHLLQEEAARAVPMLSTALQIEVVLHCNRDWLDAVWFLRELEEVCLVKICGNLAVKTLAPGELAPLRCLYVISRGLVLFGGRVLSAGQWWGDDVILSDSRYFLPHVARAMAYSDMFTLSRDELLASVEHFPDSWRRLRQCTVKLAMCRHLVLTYRTLKGAADSGKNKPRDMLDKVHDASSKTSALQAKQAKSALYATQLAESSRSSMGPAGSPLARQSTSGGIPGGSAGVGDGLEASLRELRMEMQTMHDRFAASIRDELKGMTSQLERLALAASPSGVDAGASTADVTDL